MSGWGIDLMVRAVEKIVLTARPDVVVLAVYTDDLRRVRPYYQGQGFPIPRFRLDHDTLVSGPHPTPGWWETPAHRAGPLSRVLGAFRCGARAQSGAARQIPPRRPPLRLPARRDVYSRAQRHAARSRTSPLAPPVLRWKWGSLPGPDGRAPRCGRGAGLREEQPALERGRSPTRRGTAAPAPQRNPRPALAPRSAPGIRVGARRGRGGAFP